MCEQHARELRRTKAATLAMLNRKLGNIRLAALSAMVLRDFIDDRIAIGVLDARLAIVLTHRSAE